LSVSVAVCEFAGGVGQALGVDVPDRDAVADGDRDGLAVGAEESGIDEGGSGGDRVADACACRAVVVESALNWSVFTSPLAPGKVVIGRRGVEVVFGDLAGSGADEHAVETDGGPLRAAEGPGEPVALVVVGGADPGLDDRAELPGDVGVFVWWPAVRRRRPVDRSHPELKARRGDRVAEHLTDRPLRTV